MFRLCFYFPNTTASSHLFESFPLYRWILLFVVNWWIYSWFTLFIYCYFYLNVFHFMSSILCHLCYNCSIWWIECVNRWIGKNIPHPCTDKSTGESLGALSKPQVRWLVGRCIYHIIYLSILWYIYLSFYYELFIGSVT